MKKIILLLMSIVMMISVCACSSDVDTTYTVTKNGTDYVVDAENCTIFDDENVYQYTFSKSSSGYNVKITYPDGSFYSYNKEISGSISTGSGSWSDDYDEERYIDGQILCDLLIDHEPKDSKSVNPVLILVLIGVGIFFLAFPRAAWFLEYGWRYKDVEPSDVALGFQRAGGVFLIIFAVIMCFIS